MDTAIVATAKIKAHGQLTSNILGFVIGQKDITVLASAISCNADYFVTGDKKDFAGPKGSGKYPFQIVSPLKFLEKVLRDILLIGSSKR